MNHDYGDSIKSPAKGKTKCCKILIPADFAALLYTLLSCLFPSICDLFMNHDYGDSIKSPAKGKTKCCKILIPADFAALLYTLLSCLFPSICDFFFQLFHRAQTA